MRLLDVLRRGWAASGYFDQPEKLAAAVLRYQQRTEGGYITLNALKPELLERG